MLNRIFSKKTAEYALFALTFGLMLVEPSMAWAAKFTTLVNQVRTALVGVGVACITIALIFAGFSIAFRGKSIMAVMPAVIGGLVVGTAATLAGTIAV